MNYLCVLIKIQSVNMKYVVLFLTLCVSVPSCKNDAQSNDAIKDNLIEVDYTTPTDPAQLTLPNPCSLISEAQIKDLLDIDNANVNIKLANDPGNVNAQACFFKWDDPRTPNAGILIQTMTNPVYNDYPQYISNFVASKITEGENLVDSSQPIKFEKLSLDNGKSAAFSFQQARVYWNIGNDYLFMLAFNVSTINESEMKDIAEDIIEAVNSNFTPKK